MIKSNKEKTCLQTDGANLTLEKCHTDNLAQKWDFKKFYY